MSGRRFGDGPASTCTDEAWGEILRVDPTSVFFLVRACLNNCPPGASVVMIGSALAKRPVASLVESHLEDHILLGTDGAGHGNARRALSWRTGA